MRKHRRSIAISRTAGKSGSAPEQTSARLRRCLAIGNSEQSSHTYRAPNQANNSTGYVLMSRASGTELRSLRALHPGFPVSRSSRWGNA